MTRLGAPAASPLAGLLTALTHRRASPAGREWLSAFVAGWPPCPDRVAFLDAFAAAARRLGTGPLDLDEGERARLADEGVDWSLEGLGQDDLARAALLALAAQALPATEGTALVDECYRHGDGRERRAVLRALPLLPDAGRFLAIGLDACRSHIQPVFEAIACENPYPARHFAEASFNQMVLKALFTGVALDRIARLERRITPELTRMALAYARERELAGRSVPADIGRLTGARRSEP